MSFEHCHLSYMYSVLASNVIAINIASAIRCGYYSPFLIIQISVNDCLFVLVLQKAVQNDRPTARTGGLLRDTFYVHRDLFRALHPLLLPRDACPAPHA